LPDHHLQNFSVGEPLTSKSPTLDWSATKIDRDNAAAVHVKVFKNQAGKAVYEIHKEATPTEIVKSEAALKPKCIAKAKAVPTPRFWPIANVKDREGKPIQGKRLLVFHLLYPTASV
jgi:hypothetical protein